MGIPARRAKGNQREKEGRTHPKAKVITTSRGERASPRAREAIIGNTAKGMTGVTAVPMIIIRRHEVARENPVAVGTTITTRGRITAARKEARAKAARVVARVGTQVTIIEIVRCGGL